MQQAEEESTRREEELETELKLKQRCSTLKKSPPGEEELETELANAGEQIEDAQNSHSNK